jgi:hypothetical protein
VRESNEMIGASCYVAYAGFLARNENSFFYDNKLVIRGSTALLRYSSD